MTARPVSDRVFDCVGAAAILALGCPLLAFAALAIRLTDGAPVLFRRNASGAGAGLSGSSSCAR